MDPLLFVSTQSISLPRSPSERFALIALSTLRISPFSIMPLPSASQALKISFILAASPRRLGKKNLPKS